MLKDCRVDVGHPLIQREAAERLGVSARTLRRWSREGFGPCSTRVGSTLLYNTSAIEAFARGVR